MRNAVGSVQSALVLGGTSDIARAVMVRLVQQGCGRVTLAVRDPEAAAPVRDELVALGAHDVTTIAFDATRPETHRDAMSQAWQHGDVDLVLVAFGSLGRPAPELGSTTTERWDVEDAVATTTVNHTGVVSSVLAAANHLVDQGHGTVVLLSSVAGERVRASNLIYGAAKAGADSFVLGLGDALEPTGVRTMVVRPGFVHSAMTAGMEPAPLATTPEAVADDVLAGLSRGREIVWSPRALRWVMLVLRHLPRWLFRKLPL